MKGTTAFLLTALVGATITACGPSGQQAAPFDEDAVAVQVRAAGKASHSALMAGDIDGYLAAYMDDAVWLPPGAEEIVGKANARRRLRRMLDQISVEGDFKIEEQVVMSPDWVAEYGESHYRFTRKDGKGKPVLFVGSFVNIWKRDTDGKWKVTLDMWNSDRGMTPAQQLAAGK